MKVTIYIDGKQYMVDEGLTILDAALECGIDIPHLCNLPDVEAWGGCRMCLVQVEGMRGYPAACTIKVADGMKITYLSPELDQLRATNLQLILSRHPADCVTCFKNQKCELQKLAARFDMTERTYIKADLTYNKDHSNPLIIVDDRYCIGCQRCIRACKKINGSNIICMAGRGIKSHITFYEDEETLKEKCSKCMRCVEVCPVAALRENK